MQKKSTVIQKFFVYLCLKNSSKKIFVDACCSNYLLFSKYTTSFFVVYAYHENKLINTESCYHYMSEATDTPNLRYRCAR